MLSLATEAWLAKRLIDTKGVKWGTKKGAHTHREAVTDTHTLRHSFSHTGHTWTDVMTHVFLYKSTRSHRLDKGRAEGVGYGEAASRKAKKGQRWQRVLQQGASFGSGVWVN